MVEIPARNACIRKSGEASTRIRAPSAVSNNTEARERLFLGLSDRHTAQSHPISGTPADPPQPRIVNFIEGRVTEKTGERQSLRTHPVLLGVIPAEAGIQSKEKHWIPDSSVFQQNPVGFWENWLLV